MSAAWESVDIKRLRRALGRLHRVSMVSRRVVARLMGVSEGTVFSWENHRARPQPLMRARLAELEARALSGLLDFDLPKPGTRSSVLPFDSESEANTRPEGDRLGGEKGQEDMTKRAEANEVAKDEVKATTEAVSGGPEKESPAFDVLGLRRTLGALQGVEIASRATLARLLGASPGSIENWEKGRTVLSPRFLKKLQALSRKAANGEVEIDGGATHRGRVTKGSRSRATRKRDVTEEPRSAVADKTPTGTKRSNRFVPIPTKLATAIRAYLGKSAKENFAKDLSLAKLWVAFEEWAREARLEGRASGGAQGG